MKSKFPPKRNLISSSSQKTELNGKIHPSNVGSKQLTPTRACILQYQDNVKVDTSWLFLVQISRGYIQTGPSVAIRYKSGPRLINLSWQSNGRTYLDTLHDYFSEFHNTTNRFAVSTAMTCTDNGGNTALSTSSMMEHLIIIIGKWMWPCPTIWWLDV